MRPWDFATVPPVRVENRPAAGVGAIPGQYSGLVWRQTLRISRNLALVGSAYC